MKNQSDISVMNMAAVKHTLAGVLPYLQYICTAQCSVHCEKNHKKTCRLTWDIPFLLINE